MSFVRRYLLLHEAAELLRVSVSSVRRFCDEGQLQCELTPGGHRRIVGGALLAKTGATYNFCK